MKKSIIVSLLIVVSTSMHAAPFVTTFVNTTSININLELHFSGQQIMNQIIAMSQSYQVVNFDDKRLQSIVFSSKDKDKNGNYYGQLTQDFTPPQTDVTYNLSLQDVPAHTVAASAGTDAFEMPATQKIICTLASAGSAATTTPSGSTATSGKKLISPTDKPTISSGPVVKK